jgi:hypothetical membrane protein
MIHILTETFRYFGMAGCILLAIAVIWSALSFRGKRQEIYSPSNHFISELGEVGVSRQAWVFNAGLITSGILLLPFMIGLGIILDTIWGKLGILAGLWSAISIILVGVYPMNNITPHMRVAVAYFRGGLVTVFFFGIAILAQPAGGQAVPQYANIFSLLAFAAYASFLILMGNHKVGGETGSILDPDEVPARPRFWLSAILEWAVFFSTMLWFFCIALVVKA